MPDGGSVALDSEELPADLVRSERRWSGCTLLRCFEGCRQTASRPTPAVAALPYGVPAG